MSARLAKLLASLLLMLLAPPLAAAQELRYLQVEQTGRLAAGKQTMFLARAIALSFPLIDVDGWFEGGFTIGLIGVYGAWVTSYLVVIARSLSCHHPGIL